MDNMVSKERTKKTKKRHKNAGQSNTPYLKIMERPFVGIIVAVVTCLISILGWRAKSLLTAGTTPDFILPLAGDAVFSIIGLFCVALFLSVVCPEHLRRNSRVVLLSLLALLSTGLAVLLQYYSLTLHMIPAETARFLLPFALAPLLATILIGGKAGLAVGGWTSLIIALYWDRSLPVFVTGLVATSVAAFSARKVRTRTKVMRIALVIGLTQITCILGVTALNWNTPDVIPVLHQTIASIAGALLSAIVALLILPLLEHVFAITTDITLLEFSDLGHPLLQRLALEAPGTYHHSLVVANLAQAAAEAIGDNGLEARVCSYFHDIGKLTKPNFFAENIHMQHNPHDDIPPSMSTLVITAHVKEGLSLAILNKLPKPIMRAISEHHGSSMLMYFHNKAQSQLEFEMDTSNSAATASKVDEGSFRYQGPKPSTRVSAIIGLADAVEAASRSIEKTTPGHIENLVNDIVRTRLDDGQLDECRMTMQDLSTVKRSFVFTLTNMLHGRIPYPKDDNKNKQHSKQPARERQQDKVTDSVADKSNP